MFPKHFTSLELYQKKKEILLYRASDQEHRYILKSIITKDPALRQAFYDEYKAFSELSSPSLPFYYGIMEDFRYPDQQGAYLTLCMEDCSDGLPMDQLHYTAPELTEILYKIGEILLYLLNHGILYTDLNPSNVLVRRSEGQWKVILIDFTCAYYYIRNPHPDYPLKFSYRLSPSLKGQQLLIQELALLLQDILLQDEVSETSSALCLLLETGLHPGESLRLTDYLIMINNSYAHSSGQLHDT